MKLKDILSSVDIEHYGDEIVGFLDLEVIRVVPVKYNTREFWLGITKAIKLKRFVSGKKSFGPSDVDVRYTNELVLLRLR